MVDSYVICGTNVLSIGVTIRDLVLTNGNTIQVQGRLRGGGFGSSKGKGGGGGYVLVPIPREWVCGLMFRVAHQFPSPIEVLLSMLDPLVECLPEILRSNPRFVWARLQVVVVVVHLEQEQDLGPQEWPLLSFFTRTLTRFQTLR